MMQPRRRLERQPSFDAGGDEFRDFAERRNGIAPTADLRPEVAFGDGVEKVHVADLDVDTGAVDAVDLLFGARFHLIDADDRQREAPHPGTLCPLAPRSGDDELTQNPSVLPLPVPLVI